MEEDGLPSLVYRGNPSYNSNREEDGQPGIEYGSNSSYNINWEDGPPSLEYKSDRYTSGMRGYVFTYVHEDYLNYENIATEVVAIEERHTPDDFDSYPPEKEKANSSLISLRAHLENANMLSCINWVQRLNICRGVARGLKYLHSGSLEEMIVVHNRVESRNIFLDENMKAIVGGFQHSIVVSKNQPPVYDYKINPDLYEPYMDPIYTDSHMACIEADVYSLGFLMFEVLSGCLDNTLDMIRRYYDEGLHKLIDPCIKDQIDAHSLHIFAETAFRCLSFNVRERPSAYRIVKNIEEALHIQKHGSTGSTSKLRSQHYQKLEDLLIPLNEIMLATGKFDKNSIIGEGGFGVVYKGQLSKQLSNDEVAIKRHTKTGHKVKTDFLNELNLISRFQHQNIIRFIGYCIDGNEMILVYERANNGSLESHLEEPNKRALLTWVRRLKICLGAARGLEYLQSGLGEDNRVIHRDVKSGNILLDDNLDAMICDFGFSKSAFANNMQQSKLYTKIAGTNYYMDPVYHESGILRTESDVYSFGVVMFEMLSGLLAWYLRKIGDDKPQHLVNLVRRYYLHGKELLIDPQIKDQIDKSSFNTFIEIAYECISLNSKERPTMHKIVDKIEEALDFQMATGFSYDCDSHNLLSNEEQHIEVGLFAWINHHFEWEIYRRKKEDDIEVGEVGLSTLNVNDEIIFESRKQLSNEEQGCKQLSNEEQNEVAGPPSYTAMFIQ